MNREEKRRLAKQAGRKENRSRKQTRSRLFMEYESFDCVERMFMMLRNGSLLFSQKDGWVLMGLSGEMFTIVDALAGWLEYWQTVAEKMKMEYNGAPLAKLHKALVYHKPLSIKEIDAAYEVVKLQHLMYRSLPADVLSKTVNEVKEQIDREDEIKKYVAQMKKAA